MHPRERQSEAKHEKSAVNLQRHKSGKAQPSSEVGGREFGNVVEPMQAQMASGNQGLTEDFGTKQTAHGRKRKAGSEKRRKAA